MLFYSKTVPVFPHQNVPVLEKNKRRNNSQDCRTQILLRIVMTFKSVRDFQKYRMKPRFSYSS